jgi:hypothetical protein
VRNFAHGPLLLFLWVAAFVGGAAVLWTPRIWGILGLTSFYGGVPGSLTILLSWTVSTGLVFLPLLPLWGLFRWRRWDRWIDFPTLALAGWFPVCGLWIGAGRGIAARGTASTLSIFEPVLIGVFLPVFLLAAGCLLSRAGLRLTRLARSTPQPLLAYWVFASLAGFVGLSVLFQALAWLHLWSAAVLWGAPLMLTLLALPLVRWDLAELSAEGEGLPASDPFSRIGWFLLFVLLFALFQLACLPPDESDELRYHLSLPKRYLEAGGWIAIPEQAFSHFPLGLDLIFALPLSLDRLEPELLREGWRCGPKLIHLYSFLLCLGLIKIWSHREDGIPRSTQFLPVWLFATVPFAPVLATWAFVDFATGLSWMASVYFAWRLHIDKREVEDSRLLSLWIGLALGWGCLVKYTGLAWCMVFGALWIGALLLARRWRVLRQIPWIGVIPVLLAALYLIPNGIQTGNPVYPLASSLFGSGYDPVQKGFYDWHSGMKGNLNGFQELSLLQKAADLATLPFRAALFPWQFENNSIGGLLIALLPLALGASICLKGKWIALSSLGVFALWALTYRDPRFAIPLWGFLAVLIGRGFVILFDRWGTEAPSRPVWRVLFWILILVWGVGQTDEVFRRWSGSLSAIYLRESPTDYLTRRLPSYAAIQETGNLRRERGAEESLLLVLGNEQTYYFDSPVVSSDYFDGPWLASLAREASDVEGIGQAIADLGIEWIFINREVLELNAFNRVRGLLFTLPSGEAVDTVRGLKAGGPAGLNNDQLESLSARMDQVAAFRLMHSWLIRHPGFEEVPLRTVDPDPQPFRAVYTPWTGWPELKGVPLADYPSHPYTLLVRKPE